MNINKNDKKIIILNKKAKYNYEIIKIFEAGILLKGWEVKNIRLGKINFINNYIKIINDEAWIININISPINENILDKKNDNKKIKLLLKKSEIIQLKKNKKNTNTIIATSIYWKRNFIKAEIAIAKGKKLFDKRKN